MNSVIMAALARSPLRPVMIPPLHRLLLQSALTVSFAAAFLARAGTYKTITIDGDFGDWAGVPLAHEDPADSTTSADYRRIWIANDDDFLYLRFTLERAANPFLSTANLFVDTDADPATGFPIQLGSELLIQGGSGFDERSGGFNEGGVEGLGWLSAPEGEATEFELRIARTATYSKDAAPVFGGDSLVLLLESESSNFVRQETAPDSEGLPYALAAAPLPLTSALTLAPLTGATWRVNDSGTEPGADWTRLGYDDSGAEWRNGSGLFGYTPNAGLYPVPITTPLASAANTVYLRTTFDWNYASAGLVFAVSNWLSDGAVLYLNGAEVRRIRLPDGPLTAATAATGGPALPGSPEIFGISGAPLVIGANVLSVELHQASVSPADLVFGLSLTATPSYPVRLVNTDEPADQTVTAGDKVTLTAETLGTAPLSYSWTWNGLPLLGAAGPSLTFDPVLKSNEGVYTLSISNPGGTVTTRQVRLTVNVTPVTLTDSTLPADLTVLEGTPAVFAVTAAGSPPITYQWLKDGFPITDATDATYRLPAVLPGNAGRYSVQVSNPATPSLLSRGARLTVLSDPVPPTLTSLTGSPDRVTVTFSEALNATSAGTPGNYQLSGGLTVLGASIDSTDPKVVILTTSHQTLLTAYTLSVTGVKDLFGNVIVAESSRGFLSSIAVDGRFDDWADVPLAHSDPAEAPTAGTDFADIRVTNDDQFLYVRFTLHAPGNPGTFLNNLFLDADPENTGFSTYGIGSELLLQQGSGYQQKNGGFNEGGIDALDFALAPVGTGIDFELRISRSARYASDQLPVFVSEAIRFFLETENSSFVTTDTAPDSGGLDYTFVAVPPAELGPVAIVVSGDQVVLTWTGPGTLQARTSLSSGEWADVPGATSGISLTPGATPSFLRLAP
jgi:hypothetical protein